MLAYRNCKCAEQLKFTITICGSYNMGKPDIIYEDNDIIVCCKPAGIATQTRRIGQQDMESFIRNYRAAKNEPPYVGIDRKSTRLNSSHTRPSRMPSSA